MALLEGNHAVQEGLSPRAHGRSLRVYELMCAKTVVPTRTWEIPDLLSFSLSPLSCPYAYMEDLFRLWIFVTTPLVIGRQVEPIVREQCRR